MTADEIKHAVGERVFRCFWPNDLGNFDAEDKDEPEFVGTTDQGEEVEISKRAAESDLIVYVNMNLVAMDGGDKSVPVGLAELSQPAAPPQRPHDAALPARTWTRGRGTRAIHDSRARMGDVLRSTASRSSRSRPP